MTSILASGDTAFRIFAGANIQVFRQTGLADYSPDAADPCGFCDAGAAANKELTVTQSKNRGFEV